MADARAGSGRNVPTDEITRARLRSLTVEIRPTTAPTALAAPR